MRGLASVAVAALSLAGCGDRPVPGPQQTATPVPTPSPSASMTPAASSVPERVTVTTNEPFYSAAVDGDAVTLTGAGTPRRTLRISARDVAADTRRWRARDDLGEVSVTVTRQRCEDDMSGVAREFAGTLTVGEQVVRGCGFAGARPPVPENRVAIPARFVGDWNVDAAACARPATSIEGVRITPGELVFHESAGTVTGVETLGEDRIRITVDYNGEGERWTATQTLRIAGDRLTIDTAGQALTRRRCPG